MSINASVRDILKGAVRFIDDFSEPGMLHGLTVRSTVACGQIQSLELGDLPPGVISVTAADIPGANRLSSHTSHMPVLAHRTVNYIGEPIALLAGPDQRRLRQIRDAVRVEYEELPAKFSFVEYEENQVALSRQIVRGDPDGAFRDAYQVVEGEYQTGAQEHFYSDTQGAFVTREQESLIVYSSTQWPYHVMRTVSDVLGISRKDFSVRVPQTGVCLDGKIWYPSLVAAHAALLAWKSGRSVKLVYSREEDFMFSTKRSPTHISHTTALDKDGKPVAMHIRIHIDTGAYPLLSQEMLDRISLAATGIYGCGNILIESRAVRTNRPPMGAFAGFGIAHASFAAELQASRISEVAQMDPVDWKSRYFLRKADPSTPARDDPEGLRVMQHVVTGSDFSRKFAAYELLKKRRSGIRKFSTPLRGIGLSVSYQGNGFIGRGEEKESSSVIARLELGGRLVIKTSSIPSHHETALIWKQRARKILGISVDDVWIEEMDTLLVPNSGPSTLSRNITIVRSLIESACQAIQKRRFRSPLPIEVKRTFHIPKSFTWDPEALTGDFFPTVSWAAAVVEVEIDPVTLEVKIRGIWLCVDGGTIVSPEQAKNALEAGVYQSLGWTSKEFVRFNKGKIPDDFYSAYRIPGAESLFPLSIDFLESEKKTAPKGIGELPQNTIPAAYTSAVSQATGHYFDRIPISPEMIFSYAEAQ